MPERGFDIRPYAQYVFVAVFCIAFALQLSIWLTEANYLDETLWSKVAISISHGKFPAFDTPTPVHPGTALLLPAALVLRLPLDRRIAYHIALAALMALAITLSAYICFLMQPKSLWWLCVLILLAPNVIFPAATAPSAFAAVLSVLFVLLLLLIRERDGARNALALLGVCGGVLTATRIDAGVFFLALSFPYLWRIAGKRSFLVLGMAALFFAALDPYLYINAYEHVHWFFGQVEQNRVTNAAFGYTHWSLFLPSISFFFAFIYVYFRPHLTSVPRDFLLWLLASTEILIALLLISSYHPMRYFLPLMCIWEVFLALFALEYIALEPSLQKLRVKPEYIVVVLFLVSRLSRAALSYAGYYGHFDLQNYLIDWASLHLHW